MKVAEEVVVPFQKIRIAQEPMVEEPKAEEPKPEEPKAAKKVWRIEARILELTRGDQRILLGKRYQIYHEIYEGDKLVDP